MAEFDASLLDTEELRGARMVALALLADARREHERLLERPDPDALHDFRVAVRRLRSWLRAQKGALEGSVPKKALRQLRRVAQATNVSRDAEVFAEWLTDVRPTLPQRRRSGATWLLRQVKSLKRQADRDAQRVLTDRFARADELLASRLPRYRQWQHVDTGPVLTPFGAALATQIRSDAITLTRRLERVRDPSDDAEAHRARIAGKRLRYLLEPVAAHVAGGREAVTRLKGLQDTLGDLHDAHVWLESMRDHVERLGAEEARRMVEAVRTGGAVEDVVATPRSARIHAGVMVVAAAIRQRAADRLAAFQEAWGPEPRREFHESIDAIARELEGHAPRHVEIERKYLLTALPSLPEGDVLTIEQGYLPGAQLIERLRREVNGTGERLTRTVKVGTGLVRTEIEEATTRDVFDALWPLTAGRRVTKRRHRIADGDMTWEIDEFTDRNLVLAEVELAHDLDRPELPAWLEPLVVREVTGEAEYVNANLAR
jgi:CHAD domain-containing protein/CYTH domain-containing protein